MVRLLTGISSYKIYHTLHNAVFHLISYFLSEIAADLRPYRRFLPGFPEGGFLFGLVRFNVSLRETAVSVIRILYQNVINNVVNYGK